MQTVRYGRTRAVRFRGWGSKPAVMTHTVQDTVPGKETRAENPNHWVCRAGVVTTDVQ
ncbi:hypothetical protein PP460_gp052 [Streptomyces phage Muntaha]|uniref:Uncharacterized protein n=1 Tax=Streptomyces phage Muntaha TaxID=2713269 RepID=A0A6G8R3H0_9CAUD|nr:hypothetical protein PP460_gp052 [Streptomyces phage Muntaha]QIN94750.1 hypothetical protein SEA_MUNTAHA_227 [Streptomyces phage Muntaha]